MRRASVSRAALRSALVGTAIVGAVLVLASAAADLIAGDRSGGGTYPGIGLVLHLTASLPQGFPGTSHDQMLAWLVSRDGAVTGLVGHPPPLPPADRHVRAPVLATIDGSRYWLEGSREGSGWLVVAVKRDPSGGLVPPDVLVLELVVGVLLLLATFAAFLLIGRRAAQPIEIARRQQLSFTADASHELRTPLTLIVGEASLALGRRRTAADYRRALERVLGESRRMRRMVDDLLWLARFDTDPERPPVEPADLGRLADAARQRFEGVAAGKGLRITASTAPGPPPVIRAPVEWVERLLGVLLDNACRYTPDDGVVSVEAGSEPTGVRLVVEDSGPGIPDGERARIFDRFHRATGSRGGAGLGLAIAAAVVDATGGTWWVGSSELGGARLEVRWPRPGEAGAGSRRRPAPLGLRVTKS